MKTTYMTTSAYHKMLDALEIVARSFDPAAPDDLRAKLILAMGDEGGIWPDVCVAKSHEVEKKEAA